MRRTTDSDSARTRSKPKRRTGWIRPVLATTLVAAGVGVAGLTVAEPEMMDRVAGNSKVAIQREFDETSARLNYAFTGTTPQEQSIRSSGGEDGDGFQDLTNSRRDTPGDTPGDNTGTVNSPPGAVSLNDLAGDGPSGATPAARPSNDPRDTTGVTPSAGTGVGGDSGDSGGSESKDGEKSGNWFTRFLNFGKEGENSHLPEVILGPPGGEAELESCNGEFIEMIKYRQPGMPPLYSAHNTCDGDIILGWSIGQKVRVAGSDVVYEVIEERQAMPYEDSRVLEGMSGKFILQTCFYGEERMRFLSLSPVS